MPPMDPVLLTLLAQLSAQRRLLIHAYVCGLLEESDPVAAAEALRTSFADRPTQAPGGGSLDPAVSDMLAGMTDEAIEDFLERVIGRLGQIHEDTTAQRPPADAAPALTAFLDRRRV